MKIYAVGILDQTTAALLTPYTASASAPLATSTCFTYFPTATLNNYVAAFDAAGFQCHFHACGDRGVRLALDAIANAQAVNGTSGRRHRIARLFLVDAADRPRFAQLGVWADFQLAASTLTAENVSEVTQLIGATRAASYLPAASMAAASAEMTLSSDFDADELSPFLKIETVVTRATQGIPDVALRCV